MIKTLSKLGIEKNFVSVIKGEYENSKKTSYLIMKHQIFVS